MSIVAHAGVIGVDMGDEFIKTALVSVGKPFEIVLDAHSKRKAVSGVSFAEIARVVGASTAALAIKASSRTFLFINSLLGFNSTQYLGANEEKLGINGLPQNLYPYDYTFFDRGTIKIKVRDELFLWPEELYATLFNTVKNQALETEMDGVRSSERKIKKISGVAAVSCGITQRQRQALVDSAQLAGVNLNGLVHGPAAAAVHYSLDLKNFNTTSTTLIYDYGSRNVDVAIMQYSGVTATGTMKQTEAPHVQMLACSGIDSIGGHLIDIELAQMAAREFQLKHNIDISNNHRAMKKLLKEATRVKLVLSANKKVNLAVEGLTNDIDFSMPLERSDLENILESTGIIDKLRMPIDKALKIANMTMSQIDNFELIGGAWRVPRIQSELLKIVGAPLGQHMNGDEAIAMGAAFIAANFTSTFRVRKVFLSDIAVHTYSVHITGINNNENEESISKFKKLIDGTSRFFGTKTMVMTSNQDLDVNLYENDILLSKYEIRGIHKACTEEYKHLQTPKISLVFKISNTGIIKLERSFATFEEIIEIVVASDKPIENNKVDTEANNTSDVENNNSMADVENNNDKVDVENDNDKADVENNNVKADVENNNDKPNVENSDDKTNVENNNDKADAENSNDDVESNENKTNEDEKNDDEHNNEKSPEMNENMNKNNTTDINIGKDNIPTEIKKESIKKHIANLTILENSSMPQPLNEDEISLGIKLMNELEEVDNIVIATTEAKNNLETNIYKYRDFLQKDSFKAVCVDTDLSGSLELLQENEDWLYGEDGYDAKLDILQSRLKVIDDKLEPIIHRADEYEIRDRTIKDMNTALNFAQTRITSFQNTKPWVSIDIITRALNDLEEIKTRWTKNVEDQKATLDTDEPIIRHRLVIEEIKSISIILSNLDKIPKPKPKDPITNSNTNNTQSFNFDIPNVDNEDNNNNDFKTNNNDDTQNNDDNTPNFNNNDTDNNYSSNDNSKPYDNNSNDLGNSQDENNHDADNDNHNNNDDHINNDDSNKNDNDQHSQGRSEEL